MKTKLEQLYNTLSFIETKGNNTIIMATCLSTLQQLLLELDQKSQSKQPYESMEGDDQQHE